MEVLAVLWFFGIHNAVLQGPLGAISMTMVVSNIAAYQQGQELPYLVPSVIYMGMYAAGFMGFVTFFMIRSKSAKMKQLGKLSFYPIDFQYYGTNHVWNADYFESDILYSTSMYSTDRWFCDMGTNYNDFADQFESNNELIAMDDTNIY